MSTPLGALVNTMPLLQNSFRKGRALSAHAILVLSSLSFGGCSFDVPSGVYECGSSTDAECPLDYICVSGLCVSSVERGDGGTTIPGDGSIIPDDGSIITDDRCPPLEAPVNGAVDLEREAAPGESAIFSCDEARGFALVGEAALVCGEDLSWSGAPPSCVHSGCEPGYQPDSETPEPCTPCPEGSFSAEHGHSACAPWGACGAHDLEAAAPSATSDRLCYPRWAQQFSEGVDYYSYVSAIGIGSTGHIFIGGALDGDTIAYVARYTRLGERLWNDEISAGNQNVAVTALVVDADGSIYVAGSVDGALPGQTSHGSGDAFVRKYAPDGAVLWTRQFGTAASDSARAITAGLDGSIYVAGRTRAGFPGHTNAGEFDVFIRKFNAAGGALWTDQFGSETRDSAESLAVGADGSIYLAGFRGGSIVDFSAPSGGTDAFLRKYSPEGGVLWTRDISTPTNEEPRGVGVASDGSIFVVGFTRGSLAGGDAPARDEAFIIRYSPDGEAGWSRQFGSSGRTELYDIRADAEGNVYAFGNSGGPLEGEDGRLFIRKYEVSSGDAIWTHQFGVPGADPALNAGALGEDGSIFLGGQIYGDAFDGFDPISLLGDAFLVGFNPPEAP